MDVFTCTRQQIVTSYGDISLLATRVARSHLLLLLRQPTTITITITIWFTITKAQFVKIVRSSRRPTRCREILLQRINNQHQQHLRKQSEITPKNISINIQNTSLNLKLVREEPSHLDDVKRCYKGITHLRGNKLLIKALKCYQKPRTFIKIRRSNIKSTRVNKSVVINS